MSDPNDISNTNDSLELARVNWDQAGRLVSQKFGDIYFDQQQGLDESRYVFLEGNDLEKRLANLDENGEFVIAETGFGTGLNFLATWQQWRKVSRRGQLIYHGIEKYPINPDKLAEILSHWPELKDICSRFLEKYLLTDDRTYCFSWPEERVTLHLYIADVNEQAPTLQFQADAWYLDGFAPACNPDMWKKSLFEHIFRCTKTGGTLSSFTAAGPVKQPLRAAGFTIKRRHGFGKKWHMLQGWKHR